MPINCATKRPCSTAVLWLYQFDTRNSRFQAAMSSVHCKACWDGNKATGKPECAQWAIPLEGSVAIEGDRYCNQDSELCATLECDELPRTWRKLTFLAETVLRTSLFGPR